MRDQRREGLWGGGGAGKPERQAVQGVCVQGQNSRGQVGSQVGKRFSQKLEEAVLQTPSQAASERSSSPRCGAGVGGAHSTQDRNENLPALLSRSKGHARSRARLRSQLCTQPGRRGSSALTLPLCPLPGCGPGSHPPTAPTPAVPESQANSDWPSPGLLLSSQDPGSPHPC